MLHLRREGEGKVGLSVGEGGGRCHHKKLLSFLTRRKAMQRLILKTNSGKEIGFTIEGDKISADWWTPEVQELLCRMCSRKMDCDTCQTRNPWCG